MRFAVACLVIVGAVLLRPMPAHAYAACFSNKGITPVEGAVLPPKPKLVYFDDGSNGKRNFVAKINGKQVPVKVTELTTNNPTKMYLIEIRSAATGTLVLWGRTYTIKKGVKPPNKLPIVIDRYFNDIRHTTVREVFDALTIKLPAKTPAISAEVKLRRDDKAPWSTLIVPVAQYKVPGEPWILIGALGCSNNYSVPLLTQGVDIEVTLTFADGSTVALADIPKRITMPPKKP